MYKQTVIKYEQKLNKMIEQRQVQLGRYSQLEQQHVRLRDMLITLQSRNKLLQYEIDSNLLQKNKKNNNSSINVSNSNQIQSNNNNRNIISMRQPQLLLQPSSQSIITINKQPSSIILRSSSPQSSLISSSSSQSKITKMNKVKEKKNITTLFKSMVDSDSIIQPLCSSGGGSGGNCNGNGNGKGLSSSNSDGKGNNMYGVVNSVVEGEIGMGESSSKLVSSKSMKAIKVTSPTKSSSGKTITTTTTTSITTTNNNSNTNNSNTNNNTQPTFTKKPNPTDMIQSTVFQLSDNIKSSQIFNPFDNTNQNQ